MRAAGENDGGFETDGKGLIGAGGTNREGRWGLETLGPVPMRVDVCGQDSNCKPDKIHSAPIHRTHLVSARRCAITRQSPSSPSFEPTDTHGNDSDACQCALICDS